MYVFVLGKSSRVHDGQEPNAETDHPECSTPPAQQINSRT